MGGARNARGSRQADRRPLYGHPSWQRAAVQHGQCGGVTARLSRRHTTPADAVVLQLDQSRALAQHGGETLALLLTWGIMSGRYQIQSITDTLL